MHVLVIAMSIKSQVTAAQRDSRLPIVQFAINIILLPITSISYTELSFHFKFSH